MGILLPDDAYPHDPTRLPPDTLVRDRYRVISLVSRGGRGAVYKATDTTLQCTVALKQVLLATEAAREVFVREARLLAGLRHPALPIVSDYFLDSRGQFLVTQFFPGEDLGETLRRRRKSFPPHEVLHWARLLLDVLGYLHAKQPPIVHGDVKPANVKLTDAGELVLLDFGIARGSADPGRQPPATRSLVGHTSRYSAPEQIEGRETDARSDLYALGATLYHLLAGVAPAAALERASQIRAGQRDPLRSPDDLNPGIPRAMARAISRAMAFEPGDRFASAAEMRTALDGRGAIDPARHNQDPATSGKGATTNDQESTPVSSRRVDAAAPSWSSPGQHIDLVVQVRFGDSPRLGREDWPVVEHWSTSLAQEPDVERLVFPVNPWTGTPGAAAILVKVVAPDCIVEGHAQQMIEVPPDDYSKRVTFRVTTAQGGVCRMNVEVYRQDNGHLGTMPLDVRIGGDLARTPLAVASVVLQVLAGGN